MPPPRTVGVLIGYPVYESNTINDYLLSVFEGIRAAAQRYGCNLLIASGLNPAVHPTRAIPAWPFCSVDTTFVPVGPWNTDGWIVIPPVASPACAKYLDELRASGFPMVFTEVDRRGPSVVTDNAHGIFQAVEHLWQHGHRQIAFVAGHENVIGDSSIRLEGFHTALRAFGTQPDPRLIAYGQHTVHGGQAAMEQLLGRLQPFTAVVASNLRSAIGAMQALRAAGRRIPEDVALIAVDDDLAAEAQVPPITTVHLQTFEQGYQALRVLLEYIDGQHDPSTTIPIPTHLVVRRSCGCQFHTPSANRPLAAQHAITSAPRDSIIQWMTEATRSKAYRLVHAGLADRFRLLLDGFAQSLAQAHDASFLAALDGLLAYVEAAHEDPYILQGAISVLAQHRDAWIEPRSNLSTTVLVHELIDGARVVIDNHVRHYIAQGRVEQADTADQLGTMTAHLLATLDASEILAIMARYLPEVGIHHAQIVMLEAEDDDPAAWSVLWLRDPASGAVVQRRVATSAFPPPDLYASAPPFQLILIPLMAQAQQIGYIAYDMGRLDACGAITRHVVAALISSSLYREAAEGRRLAEEADQLKTRFLSMVSHELRTPLSVIVGLSELSLREQVEGKPPLRQDLERIYSSAHHLGFLIHDVLDLASSQAGQLRLTSEALDLVEALQSVIVTGGQLAYDKGLAWHVTLPDHRPIVLGDRTRLRQVALNLITNAVKFTAHGSITFAVEADDGRVTVAVRDTGLGIPISEQGLIFNEFHQSERTATRGYGGLGLGLAISRHLIDLHGGTIGVHSSGIEGAGTTFAFTLPTLTQRLDADVHPAHAPLVVVLAQHATIAAQVSAFLRARDPQSVFQPADRRADWQAQVVELSPDALLVEGGLATDQWDILRGLHEHPITQQLPIIFYAFQGADNEPATLDLEYHHVPLTLDQLGQLLHQPTAASLPSTTILLVDDDPGLLDVYTRLVQLAIPDSRILQADNGQAALAIVRHTRPDLIMLDLMMPELDGFGTLAALGGKDATRDIPVIILSDKPLTEGEMARLSHSAVVLEKGVITADEITAHITNALHPTRRMGSATQQLVRRAVAFIHMHYAESLTRDDLARYLSVSENYLTNCFQRELGVSPLTFLNRYRIKEARALLERHDQNVTNIALAVGFTDVGYFSRIFQREVGMSPSAYRRGHGAR